MLTQFWDAGLPVIAFDIGTPAERIRRRHGGLMLPCNMPVERLVQVFLDPQLFPPGTRRSGGARRGSNPSGQPL